MEGPEVQVKAPDIKKKGLKSPVFIIITLEKHPNKSAVHDKVDREGLNPGDLNRSSHKSGSPVQPGRGCRRRRWVGVVVVGTRMLRLHVGVSQHVR